MERRLRITQPRLQRNQGRAWKSLVWFEMSCHRVIRQTNLSWTLHKKLMHPLDTFESPDLSGTCGRVGLHLHVVLRCLVCGHLRPDKGTADIDVTVISLSCGCTQWSVVVFACFFLRSAGIPLLWIGHWFLRRGWRLCNRQRFGRIFESSSCLEPKAMGKQVACSMMRMTRGVKMG